MALAVLQASQSCALPFLIETGMSAAKLPSRRMRLKPTWRRRCSISSCSSGGRALKKLVDLGR